MPFLLVMLLPPALWRQEWHLSTPAELQKLEAQAVPLASPWEGCPPTPICFEPPWKLRMAHDSFKYSILEKIQSQYLCEWKVFSHDGPQSKDAETLPFKSCVIRGYYFWLKCGAVAELCSFPFDGPKSSGIAASGSLGAALQVPSSMKGSQQWI